MNQRERFNAVMTCKPVDRLPVLYFGQWDETLERWGQEGLDVQGDLAAQSGMDRDWERGMWDCQNMIYPGPIGAAESVVIEETEDYRIVRDGIGAVIKYGKKGSSISQHLEYALKPDRESWESFKKFLVATDPGHILPNREQIIKTLDNRDYPAGFMGGSLFGWMRDFMGVEAWGCLPYTDPELFQEIIDYMATYFMDLYRPILKRVTFDFAYFFEDCCFNLGSLLPPDTYREYFDKHYRRLIDFYRENGVPLMLMDSDGMVEQLIPCWLDSGFDIIFPIEVGTWNADPVDLRKKFGKRLRMLGGFDKHLIPQGEKAITEALTRLKPLVDEGGFIPIPDHRIPPDCSWEQFKTYIRIYRQIFG